MTVLIGKYLDRNRFDVKFIAIKKSQETTPIDEFIPESYPTEEIIGVGSLTMMKQMYSIIKREKPDIVFSSVLFINNKLLPFKFFFPKTKFIIRCENYLYTFSKKQQLLIKCLYRFSNVIIAQTQEMKDELVFQMSIDGSKIHVLENPIDKNTIDQKIVNSVNPYPNNGKKHFVASGRFAYQKGFDLLIDAFANVHKVRHDVDLFIIGNKEGNSSTEYEKVAKRIQELGIGEEVHCEGFQTNPYVYVRYADCFVLSSRWEGLPNVMIEALYLGTPVAAFKCIPIVERIVNEGKDGNLAEKENYESLARAMLLSIDMGRITSTYIGSTPENFTSLFEFSN